MSQLNIGNNKRIAKNTLMLYFRMLFTMAVSLYTSRVVLSTLGVEDYGVYNVVGGFVGMFSMISGAMTTATQRFLSFAIGKGQKEKISQVFSTAILVHLGLAAIILLLGETIGLWFVNTQMNFPEGRKIAAIWVFEFSLFTFLVNVISVPYNAAIVAYEKMSAFAYISIVEVSLKLLIVLFLVISPFDKLIFYALLMALISVAIRIIYGIYCSRKIKDCSCNWILDRTIFKQMASFVSWNLIGSMAGVLKEQGLNVVLNIFFGAAVNAARGVAVQVNGAINQFVSNFQMAMNPQIVKLYAANERKQMHELVFRGSRLSYLLLLCLSLPVIIEAPFILNIWLVEVPDYSVVFLRLVMIISLVDSLSYTLITSMHASGKVKEYQIIVGGLSLLTLPLAYILLKIGYGPHLAFISSLVITILCHFARLILLSKTIDFPAWTFVKTVTLKALLISLLSYIIPVTLYFILNQSWISFLIIVSVSLVSGIFFSYVFGFTNQEKLFVISFVRRKLHIK